MPILSWGGGWFFRLLQMLWENPNPNFDVMTLHGSHTSSYWQHHTWIHWFEGKTLWFEGDFTREFYPKSQRNPMWHCWDHFHWMSLCCAHVTHFARLPETPFPLACRSTMVILYRFQGTIMSPPCSNIRHASRKAYGDIECYSSFKERLT